MEDTFDIEKEIKIEIGETKVQIPHVLPENMEEDILKVPNKYEETTKEKHDITFVDVNNIEQEIICTGMPDNTATIVYLSSSGITRISHPIKINSVAFLQRNNFRLLSYEDKIRIKELGRPTPDINIEVTGSSRNKIYKRQFNNNMYNNSNWICGCEEKNKLFCFPCILFGGDKAWTVSGITDIAHLCQSIKRHEDTQKHLSNVVSLALLGNDNIQQQLDSVYWINVQKHNEQVDKNRYVLSRIIDCIKFCSAFELALKGHNEGDSSENSDVLRGFIKFSTIFDNALREHLDSSVFKGTSEDIQNELLECMLEVCKKNILAEINNANYLAVIADQTTDVASKFQMVVVLRYINNGNPVERFWEFINPVKHSAVSLAECIQSVIDPLLTKNPNKLIAQTYAGAGVMSGKHKDVQIIIKKKYPLANFVHYYAHQLNVIISQVVSQNMQVRVFFSNIDDVVNFFSNSPLIDILNEVIGRRLPRVETHCDFENRAISIIYEHRTSLIECMQKIQEQFSSSKIINQASAIERLFDDEIFLFWLNIFYHVMPNVDILYNQLQKKGTDAIHVKNVTETFEVSINNIRKNIDEIIQKDFLSNDLEPVSKRSRITKENLRASALEVCDVIIQVVKDRFEYVGHIEAALLFCSELFEKFSKNFPDHILKNVSTLYPNMFEVQRLKTELLIIYKRPDFQYFKGVVAFLNFLKINNLEMSFKETTKLLKLIITIPMTTIEAERCFSTLKRIKNFLRNTVGENRLSALLMLSIENSMVKMDINFNNKVIEKFANAKHKRMELIYKK